MKSTFFNVSPWTFGVLLALALFGCGVEPGVSDFHDQEIPDELDPELPPTGELGVGPGAGTMTGTWLMVHQASSCVLGQEQVTHAYYLVDFEEDGPVLRERRRLCALDLSPLLGFRPVATPEVLASIEFVEVDAGFVTRLIPGGVYSSATEVGLWGVVLEDPLVDPLPTSPEDPAIIDGDGDGNPGVTLQLEGSGCERYMAQRQIVRYFGELVAPNDLRGASATLTDTVVLGASAPICELSPPVQPNDGHSRFRLVRIDGLGGSVLVAESIGGEITCENAAPYFPAAMEHRDPDDDHCS
jgi:hypothetical protein